MAALDFLVALGTHTPMSDEQLTRHLGRPVVNGMAGPRHDLQPPLGRSVDVREPGHDSRARDRRPHGGPPRTGRARSRSTGSSSSTTTCSSAGRCFRTRSSGFSGGTKYLFPGIAAPEIIHFTHWLGALITSSDVIGTIDTPVRAVIDRAASLLDTPLSLLALVVTHEGVAGVFCGDPRDTWREAATLSARRHIVWLDDRSIACSR